MSVGWCIGFDLSLTAPAAVALPLDWRPGDWRRMRHWLAKPPAPPSDDLKANLDRYLMIASWAEDAVADVRSLGRGRLTPTHVFVEAYGFSRNTASGSRIMESGGIVKARLFERFGLVMRPVVASSARKFFLGFNPTRPKYNPKVEVQDGLFRCKMPHKGADVADAMLVANYGLTELHRPGLSIAESAPARKRSRR